MCLLHGHSLKGVFHQFYTSLTCLWKLKKTSSGSTHLELELFSGKPLKNSSEDLCLLLLHFTAWPSSLEQTIKSKSLNSFIVFFAGLRGILTSLSPLAGIKTHPASAHGVTGGADESNEYFVDKKVPFSKILHNNILILQYFILTASLTVFY